MSVLFGASFDNVVCLDMDGMFPWSLRDGQIGDKARTIGDRFHLGDCLIVLSGVSVRKGLYHWTRVNYHLIYDQKTSWPRIWEIIRKLAKEGILEDKLRSIKLSRGDFTVRMSRKTMDGFAPFPVGYISCDYPYLSKKEPGGIVSWLTHWRIAISRYPLNHGP